MSMRRPRQIELSELRDKRDDALMPSLAVLLRGRIVDGVPQSISGMLGGVSHDDTGSGYARQRLTLEFELALDRFQAHACAIYGAEVGAVLTFKMLARDAMEPPVWLLPLIAKHRRALTAAFVTDRQRELKRGKRAAKDRCG